MATGVEQVLSGMRQELQNGERIRVAARRTELEDELAVTRIRAEQHASQKNMIDEMLTQLRSQGRSPAHTIVQQTAVTNNVLNQPVQVQHNVNNASPITVVNNNLQHNVHHLHETALHLVQNNANRVINYAANMGASLADAYEAIARPSAPTATLQALVGASSGGPPPPPPGAGALLREALSIEDRRPVRPSRPASAPQPLALPPPPPSSSASAVALPSRPLTETERSAPYISHVKPKHKPRILAIEDATPPPPAPSGPTVPAISVTPYMALEDKPVRKTRAATNVRLPEKGTKRRMTTQPEEEPEPVVKARGVRRGANIESALAKLGEAAERMAATKVDTRRPRQTGVRRPPGVRVVQAY